MESAKWDMARGGMGPRERIGGILPVHLQCWTRVLHALALQCVYGIPVSVSGQVADGLGDSMNGWNNMIKHRSQISSDCCMRELSQSTPPLDSIIIFCLRFILSNPQDFFMG